MADDETHIGRNNEERKEDETVALWERRWKVLRRKPCNALVPAIKEHLAAYAGDRENAADGNSRPPKTLKSIAKMETSNEFKKQNLAQQAGFSAEVEAVARKNADNIIAGNDTLIQNDMMT